MTPRVVIELDGPARVYQPGDLLAGYFRIFGPGAGECQAAELSVLWYTEGKGEEDMDVHFFERFEMGGQLPLGLHRPHRFQVELPASPLSYDGVIVNIRWCVRVRVFFGRNKEVLTERNFTLSNRPIASHILRP